MTNHPKTSPNINKLTLKCIHCNKTGHTKNRCFEIVGYQDWWDHNCDQRNKDSEKASTLIVATDYDDRFHPLDLSHKKLFPQPMEEYQKEIQTLDYDYHIYEDNEYGPSELVNQEAGELDMSGTTLEPSSNDHPEIEEVIEEGRDNTIKPSPPSEQFGSEDVFTEIPN
ncbi:hypothetical protein CK203_003861 [Vitis vinifera]|uniref:CCHC-type domain-containing protein n=1 Tax=Vitis vinifera TaxID=29760 RepID=A0A438K8F5_VITVI|nr:hypothetical protein CK203_069246 [Vitis vinifera]RVX17483.1 hypothetical protein CK203_003861 [Vitis vinifera]